MGDTVRDVEEENGRMRAQANASRAYTRVPIAVAPFFRLQSQ